MEIYHYSEDGVFIGSSSARPSPLEEGVYLIPAYATDVPPPETSDGQAAVFSEGAWALAEDHRGKTIYDTTTRAKSEVESLGPLPDGKTTQEPPSPHHVWDGTTWTLMLKTAKTLKKTEFKRKAHNVIVSRLPDWKQRNLTARMVELVDKGKQNLTTTEQAEMDAARTEWAWVKDVRTESDRVETEVEAAETNEEVEAVTPAWPEPPK